MLEAAACLIPALHYPWQQVLLNLLYLYFHEMRSEGRCFSFQGSSSMRTAWSSHSSAGCERNMGLRQKLEAEEGFPYSSRLWQGKWVVLSISHIYTVTLWSVRSCFFFFIFFPVFKLSLSFLSSVTDFDCDFHLGLEAWSSLPNCTALASAHFHCLCACCFLLVSAFLWCFWRAAASRLTNYAI